MHVKCIGLALLIGISLIDWGHKSARPGAELDQEGLPQTPSAVFPLEDSTHRNILPRALRASRAKSRVLRFGVRALRGRGV